MSQVELAREAMRSRAAMRPRGPSLTTVRDLTVGGSIAARLYRPTTDPAPFVLFFHGGGFVLGDLETHDRLCRLLAKTSVVTVLSVDYRRAPEHPGPAAVDDAVRASVWALEHLTEFGGDEQVGIALAGDSAGGAIAVLTGVRLRAVGVKVAGMLLLWHLTRNRDACSRRRRRAPRLRRTPAWLCWVSARVAGRGARDGRHVRAMRPACSRRRSSLNLGRAVGRVVAAEHREQLCLRAGVGWNRPAGCDGAA